MGLASCLMPPLGALVIRNIRRDGMRWRRNAAIRIGPIAAGAGFMVACWIYPRRVAMPCITLDKAACPVMRLPKSTGARLDGQISRTTIKMQTR